MILFDNNVFPGSIEGGWEAARPLLAEKYRMGGYPDMAEFIEHV